MHKPSTVVSICGAICLILASDHTGRAAENTCRQYDLDDHSQCIDADVGIKKKTAPDTDKLKDQDVSILPPDKAGRTALNKLYRVKISCAETQKFPATVAGVLEDTTTVATHMIGLMKGDFSAQAMPPADALLLLLPVYSITGDQHNLTIYQNTKENCNRTFLVTGRDQPTVISTLSISQTNTPTKFAGFLYGLANVITPLLPFFGSDIGAIAKKDLPAVSATQTPLQNLLAQFNSSKTTLVNSKLLVGDSTRIVTPWTTVSISVSPIESLIDQADLLGAFEASFKPFGETIAAASSATAGQTCTKIGHDLQFNRNLSLKDAAYALAHGIYLGGNITRDLIVACLGEEYGPIAITLSYWKETPAFPVMHSYDFPIKADKNFPVQQPFSGNIVFFQQMMGALNDYVGDKTKSARLVRFFENPIVALDVTNTTDAVGSGPIKNGVERDFLNLIDQLKKQGYSYFGCPASDAVAAVSTGQGAAAAFLILKVPSGGKDSTQKLSMDTALIARVWADSPDMIGMIHISDEAPAIENVVKANGYKCSASVMFAKGSN
jgi:hypothetical protein